jgi:hypothetical protein
MFAAHAVFPMVASLTLPEQVVKPLQDLHTGVRSPPQ